MSGPARPKPGRPATAGPQRPRASSAHGVLPGLTAGSATRLLDRLIAGKAWIAIVAFALIGIVTLQLALLELNAGIGRAIVRAGSLQRENAELSIEDAELTSGTRIETQASKLGMQIVPAGEERFLSAGAGSATARAAHVLRQPAQTAPAVSSSGTESPSSSAQAESVSSGASTGGEAQSSSVSGTSTSTGTGTSTGTSTGSGSGSGSEATSAGSAEPQVAAPATGTPAGGSGSEAGAATATASSGAAAATSAGAGESTAAGGTQPAAAG